MSNHLERILEVIRVRGEEEPRGALVYIKGLVEAAITKESEDLQIDAWRYCPVASSDTPSRQCLANEATQLLAALQSKRPTTDVNGQDENGVAMPDRIDPALVEKAAVAYRRILTHYGSGVPVHVCALEAAIRAVFDELGLHTETMEPDPRSTTQFHPQERWIGPWRPLIRGFLNA